MVKRIVEVFACAMLILSMVGCGVTEKFSSPKEIVFYHFDKGNEDTYEKIVQSFNEQHQDILVISKAVDYDGYMDELRGKKGKLNADVFIIKSGEEFEVLSSEKKLLELKKLNYNEYKPRNDILKSGQIGKKLYAIPISLQAYGILYNQEIFENEGLITSNRIDDFIINIQKLIEKGCVPFSICGGEDGQEMALRLFEGILINSLNNFDLCFGEKFNLENILSDNGMTQSVLYINQLSQDDYVKIDTSISTKQELLEKFSNGEFAMMIGDSSMLSQIQMYNPGFKCAVQNIPGAIRDSYLIVQADKMVGISKKTKHKKEAKCFLEYLIQTDVLTILCDETGILPTNNLDGIKNDKVKNLTNIEKYGYVTSIFDRIPKDKKDACKKKAYEALTNPIYEIENFVKSWQNIA